MINILGLGPGSVDSLTKGALDILNSDSKFYIRTIKHPTMDYIKGLGIEYIAYDYKYENAENFDEIYEFIAMDLISEHEKYKNITYAVPGHPLVAEKSVSILINYCRERSIPYKIIPAVSFIDAMIESLNIDPVSGLRIIDAFDINNQIQDKRTATIITQTYNRLIMSEVKLWLLQYYDAETEVSFVRAAGINEMESIRKMPIYEIDRQEDIDYLTSLYIPNTKGAKDFYDLIGIMGTLRGEEGCPWDREQSHDSIKPYLIEETYEVLEAIDEADEDMLVEELGDLLLQIVFHAQISKEEGYFDIQDIIKGICEKMISRHPHVFGQDSVETSKEVLVNWDKIKKQEKGYEYYWQELSHVPKNLPALMRANKVQKKAAKFGMDFEAVEAAMDKVEEELKEVKDVYKSENKAKISEEVGDLIFSVINVARFLDIEPETALNCTIEKFIKRFKYIEEKTIQQGKHIQTMSLFDLDFMWKEAKNHENQ